MQAAENAKTLAMAQGQQADNLSWANRVQSMQDETITSDATSSTSTAEDPTYSR